MQINSVNIKRFAGLSDKNIVLTDGINVLLGNNEAGKSTIVNAISSALFMPTIAKRKGSGAIKNAINKFTPLSGGDTYGVELSFSHNKKQFTLTKQWGKKSSSELSCENGGVYTNEEEITAQLGEILKFSPATYESLVFAKQDNFKKTIENIKENGTQDIGNFLNQAVIDLGGVSIPKLQDNLKKEYNRLTGNWDIELSAPNNSRGLDNKYVNGNGTIIEYYYQREMSRRAILEVEKAEKRRDECINLIGVLKSEIDDIQSEIDSLRGVSDQMMVRSEKEKTLSKIKNEINRLEVIEKDWVELDIKIEKLQDSINTSTVRIEEYKKLLEQLEKYEKSLEIKKKLEKVMALESEALNYTNKLNTIDKIDTRDIKTLDKLERDILKLETQTNGASIKGKVRKKDGVTIFSTVDFEKETILTVNDIEANKYIKIRIDDIAEIELNFGEIDYSRVKTDYDIAKALYLSACEKLNVANKQEAEEKKKNYDEILSAISQLKERISDILGDDNIDKLKSLSECEKPNIAKADVLENLENFKRELAENEVNKSNLQAKRNEYKLEFTVYNKVLSLLNEEKNKAFPLDEQIQALTTCPDKFNGADEFITYTKSLTDKKNEKTKECDRLIKEYELLEQDVTTIELTEKINTNSSAMERDIQKAKSIDKVIKAIRDTKSQIEKMTYVSLEKTFNEYLSLLTMGKYEISNVDESLGFMLSNKDYNVSIEQLSSGTLDCVALAFRFSMLDAVMDSDSFCVLDDCLVDLDKNRKEKAMELIKHFAKNHQMIFATCSEEVAEGLSGNIIKMS